MTLDHQKRYTAAIMAITAYIGVGTNLGDLIENLRVAQAKFNAHPQIQITRSSKLYQSEPLTPNDEEQPWYLNAVFEISTTLSLHLLFDALKDIEKTMGRKSSRRWASRLIDLDILFYGNVVYTDKAIQIPHREMQHRRFVLAPLCDLIPNFIHPDLNMPLTDILAHTTDKLECKLLQPNPQTRATAKHA